MANPIDADPKQFGLPAKCTVPVGPDIDLSDMVPRVIPPEETIYFKVATKWQALGFNVIPGDKSKEPMVGFKRLSGENPQALTLTQISRWATLYHVTATPLLLPDSGRLGVRLVFVDADDLAMVPWIREQFGDTPFTVGTGRPGGGEHLVYRSGPGENPMGRNKIIGPDAITWDYTIATDGRVHKAKNWGKTAIDVKARRNYVVAAGAQHKSGLFYTASVPDEELTLDFLKSLPIFDNAKYERLVQNSSRRKQEHEGQIWIEVRRLHPSNKTAEAIVSGGTLVGVEGLTVEPFFAWCEHEPEAVGLSTWWGMAMNLAALRAEDGRGEFHRLSARSEKYQFTEADATYSRALLSLTTYGPTGYSKLLTAGFPGPVPAGFKSPAAFIRGQVPALPTPSVPAPGSALLRAIEEDRALAASERQNREPIYAEIEAFCAEYEERLARRKRQAEALDPIRVEIAQRVVKLAAGYRPVIRKHLTTLGLTRPPRHCGYHQGLANVATLATRVVTRGCGKLSCYFCGPRLWAIKVAGASSSPEVAENGQVVWGGLDHRKAVYLHEVPVPRMDAWLRQFRRLQSNVRGKSISIREKSDGLSADIQPGLAPVADFLSPPPTTTSGLEHRPSPMYAAFWGHGTVWVLTDLDMPPSRKSAGHRGALAAYAGIEDIRQAVFSTALRALGVDKGDGVEDLFGEPPTVSITGHITTSSNLRLDPDAILRTADPNAWFVHTDSTISPDEAEAVYHDLGIPATVVIGDGSDMQTYCTSGPVETVALRATLSTKLKRRAPPASLPIVLDTSWDGTLGLGDAPRYSKDVEDALIALLEE